MSSYWWLGLVASVVGFALACLVLDRTRTRMSKRRVGVFKEGGLETHSVPKLPRPVVRVTLWVITIVGAAGLLKTIEWMGLPWWWLLVAMFVLLCSLQLLVKEHPFGLNCLPAHPRRFVFEGHAAIPSRVYIGNSHTLSITLARTSPLIVVEPSNLADRSQFSVRDSDAGKSVSLTPQASTECIEIELLAAGVELAGDKVQRHSADEPVLTFMWNCHFANSGDHRISLVVSTVTGAKRTAIGTIEQAVRVAQFDGLTRRQVMVLGGAAGAVTAVSGIMTIIRIWKKDLREDGSGGTKSNP